MLPVFVVGALAVAIERDFGITAIGLGLAVSGYYGASMLLAIPGGYLSDRLGPRTMLRAALVVSSVALAGLGFATSWVHIALLLALAGCANGLSQPAANLALVQGVRDGRRGWAFGVKQSAVPLAALAAGAAVPTIGVTLGWRWVFMMGAIAALTAIFTIRPIQVSRGEADSKVRPSMLKLIWYGIVGALGSASANSLAVFLVPWAVASGVGIGAAGLLLSAASMATIVVRLLAGRLIDRRASVAFVMTVGLLLLGAGGFVIMTTQAISMGWIIIGALVAFGAGWGWTGLLIFGVAREYRHIAGRATGVLQSLTFTGGMVGPLLFGIAVEQVGYSSAWFIASGVTATAGIVLAAVRLRGQRHEEGTRLA